MTTEALKPAQSPLSFIAPIKEPVAENYIALKQLLESQAIGRGLDEVGTVHFGRFMFLDKVTPPAPEKEYYTKFALFTAYDGEFDIYVQDFVDVVGAFFDALLSLLENGSQYIPVNKNAKAFARYVESYNQPVTVWYSAYPNLSVKDILECDNNKPNS